MSRYLILNEKDEIVDEIQAEGYREMVLQCKEKEKSYIGCQAYILCAGDLVTEINNAHVQEEENV